MLSERGSTWLWRIIRAKEAAQISNVTPPTFTRFYCAEQCSISMQLAEFAFPPPGAVMSDATVDLIQKCSIANARVVQYFTHLAHAFDSPRLGTQWLHGWSIPGWRQPEDIVDKDGGRDGGGDLRPGLSLPRLSGILADRNSYRPSPRFVAWTYKVNMLPVVMICGGGDICGAGDICGGFFLFYSYYTWWLCRPCGSEENIVQQVSPDNFQEIIDYEVVIIWGQCPYPPRSTKMVAG